MPNNIVNKLTSMRWWRWGAPVGERRSTEAIGAPLNYLHASGARRTTCVGDEKRGPIVKERDQLECSADTDTSISPVSEWEPSQGRLFIIG